MDMLAECAEADAVGKALAGDPTAGRPCAMLRSIMLAGMVLGVSLAQGEDAGKAPPKGPRSPQVNYPVAALRKGIEGTVEIRYTVQPDGTVTDVTLLNQAPKELAAPVVAVVGKWNAGPAQPGDPARPEVRTQRFQFRLAEDELPAPKLVAVTDRQLQAIKVISADRSGVVGPVCVRAVEPVYPADLPRPGSKVTVEFEVGAAGKVGGVEFPKPIPEALATAVKAALEAWEFRPATKDRQPVPVRVRFVFEFNRLR